jgi:hypothetical protein
MQDGKHLRGPAGLWRRVGLSLAALALAPFLAAAPVRAMSDDTIEGELKPEGGKPIFLVTEIVVEEGIAVDKNAARDALANRFGRLKDKIEVRSLAEMKTSLEQSALLQMVGSDAPDTALANIQDYVAVDRLVFGRIFQVAGVTEVQVRIFNAREGTTEIGLSRRLKADAAPALVLTLLDTLADGLLAYVIDTYTDAKPSAAFDALSKKKIVRDAPAADAPQGGGFGALATLGGVVAGVGAGVVAGSALGLFAGAAPPEDPTLGFVVMGAGGAAVLIGAGVIVADALIE